MAAEILAGRSQSTLLVSALVFFFIAVRRTFDLRTCTLLHAGPAVARSPSSLLLAGRQPELLFSATASLSADEFRKLMESERRGRVVTSICYTRRERFIWNVSRLLFFSIRTTSTHLYLLLLGLLNIFSQYELCSLSKRRHKEKRQEVAASSQFHCSVRVFRLKMRHIWKSFHLNNQNIMFVRLTPGAVLGLVGK